MSRAIYRVRTTHDYSTCDYSMSNYYTRGQTHDSHEWNTCRHKCAINIHYSPASSLLNSVHNSENYKRNALINSCINHQGNGLIAHVIKMHILILVLTIVVSCSVLQLYERKQSKK